MHDLTRVHPPVLQDAEQQQEQAGTSASPAVPTSAVLVPTTPVAVAVHMVGTYRLKGVAELVKLVQVLPAQLAGRLEVLGRAELAKGKARCVVRSSEKLAEVRGHGACYHTVMFCWDAELSSLAQVTTALHCAVLLFGAAYMLL